MVEENVVDRKARKRIEDAADQRVIRTDETAQQGIGRRRAAGEFENEERPHQIGHRRAREGDGQPEKRAAEQIKRIRSHKIGAEVGRPVPGKIACPHAVVSHLIKRDLLDVEVPVIDEIPLVQNEEGEEQERRARQGQEKREQSPFPGFAQ